jgi:hypothetical protein
VTISRQPKQDSLGALGWFIVLGVLLYGLFAMLAWPFRRAMRLVPGRQEKTLRAFSADLRTEIPDAIKLVQELGAGVPGLDTKMTHRLDKLQDALNVAAAERKWPEDLELESPLYSAIEILEKAKCVGAIEHRSDMNELKKALNPLLRKQGVKFDWDFLKELEDARDWAAFKNENLLPTIGDKLNSLGYVFTHIDDGSDNYIFSLCTSESFSRLESVASGGYAIRRFALAARAA